MTMREIRPAFLLAAPMSSAAVAGNIGTGGANGRALPGGYRPLADGLGSIHGVPIVFAVAILLFGLAVLLAVRRTHWRLGAIVMIACLALLGGGALVDGIETVIAVTP